MKVTRLLSVAALLVCAEANANVGPVPVSPPSVIQGKLTNEKIKKVSLFVAVEGRKEEIASSKVNDEQAFAFAIPAPKEGFYYISTGTRGGDTRIYLKKGDKLTLTIDNGGYTLQSGSAENKALQQWSQQIKPLTDPVNKFDTTTFMSYFPTLEAIAGKVNTFKKGIATPNKAFNDQMKFQVDVDLERIAMQFLLMPHSLHPKVEQYSPFYQKIIQDKKYADGRILLDGDASHNFSLYETYCSLLSRVKERPKAEERIKKAVELFGNDSVKAVVITQSIQGYKTFEGLMAAVEPVKEYLVTAEQKSRYLAYEKSVRNFAAGEPALAFNGEDLGGKQVALSDFKGKVVVVDVWATWCGPCKAEIPHLAKLEEEMEGKNVIFLGCSVDELKDKAKWKDFVNEKQMKGVQIFTKGYSDLTKLYDIPGIPRFMVFDQKGNIVNIDAPRPSTPELKTLIEKVLAKG